MREKCLHARAQLLATISHPGLPGDGAILWCPDCGAKRVGALKAARWVLPGVRARHVRRGGDKSKRVQLHLVGVEEGGA